MIRVYCDGFSSPHKKNSAGVAIYIETSDGKFLHSSIIHKHHASTNNEMEIEAIKTAADVIRREARYADVTLISDSTVAIGLITGKYKTKKPHLKMPVEAARNAVEWARLIIAGKLTLKWEPRRVNKAGKMIEAFRRDRTSNS